MLCIVHGSLNQKYTEIDFGAHHLIILQNISHFFFFNFLVKLAELLKIHTFEN
jgi:hypothetical protein